MCHTGTECLYLREQKINGINSFNSSGWTFFWESTSRKLLKTKTLFGANFPNQIAMRALLKKKKSQGIYCMCVHVKGCEPVKEFQNPD